MLVNIPEQQDVTQKKGYVRKHSGRWCSSFSAMIRRTCHVYNIVLFTLHPRKLVTPISALSFFMFLLGCHLCGLLIAAHWYLSKLEMNRLAARVLHKKKTNSQEKVQRARG